MLPVAGGNEPRIIRTGMHHDLRRAGAQILQDMQEMPFMHRFACHDALEMIRHAEMTALRLPEGELRQREEPEAADELPHTGKGREERRPRDTHGVKMQRRGDIERDIDHPRQHVHVLVTVDMRQGKTGPFHFRSLRHELTLYILHGDLPLEKMLHKFDVVIKKDTLFGHERGNILRFAYRKSVHKRQMDADTQLGVTSSHLDGIIKGLAARHERRRAQTALLHAALDGLIDKNMPAKVVGIDKKLIVWHKSPL